MGGLEERIRAFLGSGDGDGYGDGDGSGSGSGSGDGYGYGDGSGYGYGYGYGDGYGDGYGYGSGDGSGSGAGYGDGDGDGDGSGAGDGIRSWRGQNVYLIDTIPTLIDSVHGNYAKGCILQNDFTTKPCFVAKVEGCFAHGETLHQAFADTTNKAFEYLPQDERIDKFVAEYPCQDMVVKNTDLFTWHNRLTGSCEMGRRSFAEEHGIDVENGSMTVVEFIRLTENSYGSDTIKELKERYEQ